MAQEQANSLDEFMCWQRHQPKLAVPVGRYRWRLNEPMRRDFQGQVVQSTSRVYTNILPGQVAGDAPENKALLAYINNLAAGKGVQLYIDVHSYSQLFMTRPFQFPLS